jgi:hypothetical protein
MFFDFQKEEEEGKKDFNQNHFKCNDRELYNKKSCSKVFAILSESRVMQ